MSKSTHFGHSTSQFARVGGVPISHKGAQDVIAHGVPNNWYPVNLPSASNGAPTQADCQRLLNTLAALVARLTIQQSVALALAYRTVQSNVALSGNFTVNGVSGSSNTLFDAGQTIGEAVSVDVVNKNPSLGFDLALRLAKQTAYFFDGQLLGLYSNVTAANTGAQGTTPTSATLATALGELPVTGEPVFGIFTPAVIAAMEAANNEFRGAYHAMINGVAPLGVQTGVTPGAGTRPMRFVASESVTSTGAAARTVHNLAVLPSFWALATADLGTQLGQNAVSFLTGNTQIQSSVALDPEFGTPQLALQLMISNTGSGPQTVYVNAQFAALPVNPANAVQILA